MNDKICSMFIWLGLIVGSIAGSYIPCWWGSSIFSFSSIIGGAVGGFGGIWIGFKLGRWLDL
jgi:hypothetical protein